MDSSSPPSAEVRTSGLGLVSLGCALLSVAACGVIAVISMVGAPSAMVGVLVLPVLGLTGVGFGAASLIRKRARDGALYSRGPAVAGVIIGLASAVLQGSVLLGAARTYLPVKRLVVPVVNAMISEQRAGRTDRAVRAVGESARAIAGPRLAAFLGEMEGVCGEDMRADFSIGAVMRATSTLGETMAQASPSGLQSGAPPKPVEIKGAKGRVSLWLLLDERELARERVKIVDMMAILPGSRVLVLLPDGRFGKMARSAGLEVVELSDERSGASGAQPGEEGDGDGEEEEAGDEGPEPDGESRE